MLLTVSFLLHFCLNPVLLYFIAAIAVVAVTLIVVANAITRSAIVFVGDFVCALIRSLAFGDLTQWHYDFIS